tara:strand:+ start:322 stop:510 length:189 start_codon:yes stop_codon:yes gene_type:complete
MIVPVVIASFGQAHCNLFVSRRHAFLQFPFFRRAIQPNAGLAAGKIKDVDGIGEYTLHGLGD